MDLYSLTKALGRRWYVVIPVVALGLLTTNRVLASVEPTYESRGSVFLLLPSGVAEDGTAPTGNPYTSYNRALEVTAAILAGAVGEGPWRPQLVEQGLSRDFDVANEDNSSIIAVRARASSPEQASATVTGVFEALQAELTQRQTQRRAPETLRIELEPLFGPTDGTRLTVQENRALAAMIALTIIAVVATAMLAESWNAGRRAERERRAAARTAVPPSPSRSIAAPPTDLDAPTPGDPGRRSAQDPTELHSSRTRPSIGTHIR